LHPALKRSLLEPCCLGIAALEPKNSNDERLVRLEAELILLRAVIAHLAPAADPQARVGIVRKLTGPAATITPEHPRTDEHDKIIAEAARTLLKMMAASAA
jgi:hypothetical protein